MDGGETFEYTRFKLHGLLFGVGAGIGTQTQTSTSAVASSPALGTQSTAFKSGSIGDVKREKKGKENKKEKEKEKKEKEKEKKEKEKKEKKEKEKERVKSKEKNEKNDKRSKIKQREDKSSDPTKKQTNGGESADVGGEEGEPTYVTVWYAEGLKKIIRIAEDTTALEVCEQGAKKLGLQSFTFGLYVKPEDGDLRFVVDTELPYKILVASPKPPTFLFLSKPKSINLDIRLRTFIEWINYTCAKRLPKKAKTVDDLMGGVALHHLAEAITGKRTGKFIAVPKTKAHRKENLQGAVELLATKHKGIDVTLAGSIANKDEKALHTLLWQVFFGEMGGVLGCDFSELVFFESLYEWCKKCLAPYAPRVIVTDFNLCWQDGLAFCALLEANDRFALNFNEKATGEPLENMAAAFLAARKHHGIPMLLNPEDFVKYGADYDELSIIMYLVMCYCRFQEQERKKEEQRKQAVVTAPVKKAGDAIILRVYFEGFKDIEMGTFAFKQGQLGGDVRAVVAKKKSLVPASFSVLESFLGEEYLLDDEDELSLEEANDPNSNYQIRIRARVKKGKSSGARRGSNTSAAKAKKIIQEEEEEEEEEEEDDDDDDEEEEEEEMEKDRGSSNKNKNTKLSRSDEGGKKGKGSGIKTSPSSPAAAGGGGSGISAEKAAALRAAMLAGQQESSKRQNTRAKQRPVSSYVSSRDAPDDEEESRRGGSYRDQSKIAVRAGGLKKSYESPKRNMSTRRSGEEDERISDLK